MRRALLLVAVAIGVPRAARAENCVDKEIARAQGGTPCMDIGTAFGRAELWTAPGLTDLRVEVLRMAFYGNDEARRATGFTAVTWEAIGDDGDDLEAPRDFGERSALHVVTVRREIDRDDWGAYVAGDAVTRWFGRTRVLTPRIGLRYGRFERAAAIVEARFAGAYLIGGGDDRRSLTEDLDVTARATLSVQRRVRLEARGRYRDLTGADGRRLRDLFGAIGVELEASPPGPSSVPSKTSDNFRVMTLFAGVGVRRALVDVDPGDAPLTGARVVPSAAAPWALMAWLDLDVCINSSRAIW